MRKANINRDTRETQISCDLNIEGLGQNKINTGIGFFDHMLTHIAVHGFFDIEINAKGDTYIDSHHTIEDVGIALGKAFAKALGDKKGIVRYGSSIIPMDETLALVSLDISGRNVFVWDAKFSCEMLGDLQTEMIREFFQAFAQNCPMNLHIKILQGENNHHIAEAIFKAFGKAIDIATTKDPRIFGTLSTKGMLE